MAKKIRMSKEKEALYKELKSLSKRANMRILRLEQKIGKGSLGVRFLKSRLDITPLQAWSKTGRVRASKKYSESQMTSIIKALKMFIKSELTTKRGLKGVRQRGIEGLQDLLSTEKTQMTYQEAEALYYIFEDKEVNDITNYIPRKHFTSNVRGIKGKR